MKLIAFLLCALLAPVPAWADITFANLGVSANPDVNTATNATSYATASWTPPTSGLIIVFIGSRGASAGTGVEPTISGNSITWVSVATLAGGSESRVTMLAANASGSTAGATTIDFASNTQRSGNISFFHATGVDLSGGVLASFVQAPTASGTGDTVTVNLAAAGNAANRPIMGAHRTLGTAMTPRANWTEIDDLVNADVAIETQWRTDAFETTATTTGGGDGSWLAIAAEIKAELTVAVDQSQGGMIQ